MTTKPKAPFFSIVIPSLNEEEYLPKLLGDLVKQTYQDFEIIHIDGNSDDQTVAKAQSFNKKLNISSIPVKVRNVSFQRNTGAKKAKGEWILFFDADNRLPSYYLDGLRYQIAKDPATDIFTTWVRVDGRNQIFRTIEQLVNVTTVLYDQLDRSFAAGAMIGIRRKYRRENEFDQTQKILEDYYFVNTAVERGLTFSIFREPRYVVSLRRYRKETLKTIAAGAIIQLKFLSGGKKFSDNDHGYVMKGGAYYDQIPGNSLFSNLSAFFKKASQKQLADAKRIFATLTRDL